MADARDRKLTIRPLTAARVDDVKTVTRGTWGSTCWDLFPRYTALQQRERGIAGAAKRTNEAQRRAPLAKLARRRKNSAGLVAYQDGEPIGFTSLGPRDDFAVIERSPASPPVDEIAVWVIPCTTVRRGHRGQGVAVAMIRAAVEYAGKRGAPAVEAYPRAQGKRLHDDYAFTGTDAMFRKAGFEQVRAMLPGLPKGWAPRVTMRRTITERAAPAGRPGASARELRERRFARVARGRQETLTAPEHHPAVSSAVEASVRRYGETEPRLHAFTHFDAENSLLLEAALIATGATGALVRTPVGVKDIFDMAGAPTERGSALYAGRIAESDAVVVRNLRAAGAVIVGKTVTAELAMAHPGPTRNPWDLSRTSGGSSMGSAAAVAAGVVPLAVGSQTNGSVIRPAAFCGVVGFKPTFGRLSREGMFVTSETLDQVGGFARSVREAASLVAAMAGEPLARWWSDDATPPKLAALRTGEWEHADVAAQKRFQDDVDRLAAAGGPIAWPSPPPGLDDAAGVLGTIMLFEEARAMERDMRGRETLVSEIARARLAEGAAISVDAYREALRSRERLAEAFTSWATPYDAILTPATVGEAPTPETTGDPRFCTRWSLLGTPAIVIPSGLGPSRLPLGLQLVASSGDDRRLLAAAAWCEATLPPIGAPAL